MYFLLTRRAEVLQKTNLIAFISLFDLCTFYQHSTFGLLMSKEKLKGKGTVVAFSFFHSVIISRINARRIRGSTTSEKGYGRVPWSFGFL